MKLYEMRWVLEGTAARLAARGDSIIEIDELDAISAEMADAIGNRACLTDLNRQFHKTLIVAARNRYLARAVRAIDTTLLVFGPSSLEDAVRALDAVTEHQAVVGTLRQSDGSASQTWICTHFEAGHRSRPPQMCSRGRLVETSVAESTQNPLPQL